MPSLRFVTVLFVGLFTLGISGCGAAHSRPSPTEMGTVPAGSNPAFAIRNSSSHTVCYVYVSLTSDGSWGPDQLGSSETIAPGQTRGWRVPAGTYDFMLQNCNGDELDDFRGVPVGGDGVVLTHR